MKKVYRIPFNKPHLTGNELRYIKQAHGYKQLAGDGFFTKKCQRWMQDFFQNDLTLLTHSCTAALEMMAILSDVGVGDEIIMPDYTFVSTANAFVLRKATPVFVDIRPDTLNINEQLIEKAITKRTKAIMVVHYAGVSCEMDYIHRLARKYKLIVLEDAAQGFLSTYKGRYLGTVSDMAAFSFHETKNIISGEGGALLLNKKKYRERAKIIWEKGTNRSKFFEGRVDKYSWVDIGSSYLPGEIVASFLMAQLEKADDITKKRMRLWNRYHMKLKALEDKGCIRRPVIPSGVGHNAHLYYMLTNSKNERINLMAALAKKGILTVTHYVPLHSSKGGRAFSRHVGSMKVTNRVSDTLMRLPLFYDLKMSEQDEVIQHIYDFYRKLAS